MGAVVAQAARNERPWFSMLVCLRVKVAIFETLRRAMNGDMKKLNDNKKFYPAPQPLYGVGFYYHSTGARKRPRDRNVITARYVTEGPADTLKSLADKIRAEGITQPRNMR